jgi:hypothetical protein
VTDQRIHASAPDDEYGKEDEDSCEKWHPERGLVDHVVKRHVMRKLVKAAHTALLDIGGS